MIYNSVVENTYRYIIYNWLVMKDSKATTFGESTISLKPQKAPLIDTFGNTDGIDLFVKLLLSGIRATVAERNLSY